MRLEVFDTAQEVAEAVATRIAAALVARPSLVLGLPAGRTPILTYAELRRRHAVLRRLTPAAA